jgi:hypothetical protein
LCIQLGKAAALVPVVHGVAYPSDGGSVGEAGDSGVAEMVIGNNGLVMVNAKDPYDDSVGVRGLVLNRNLHSRVPLVPTPAYCKHACMWSDGMLLGCSLSYLLPP